MVGEMIKVVKRPDEVLEDEEPEFDPEASFEGLDGNDL